MQILLMCAHDYGSVGFPAKWIEGHHAPERRYEIRNGQVVLDNGLAEAILHHDAEELLKNPLYRMPTPAEQEAWTKARNEAMTAQEEAENHELTEDVEQEQEAEEDVEEAHSTITGLRALQKSKRPYHRKK